MSLFLSSPMRVVCFAHSIPCFNLFTVITFVERHKFWISSLHLFSCCCCCCCCCYSFLSRQLPHTVYIYHWICLYHFGFYPPLALLCPSLCVFEIFPHNNLFWIVLRLHDSYSHQYFSFPGVIFVALVGIL
jgi:hypothetical protein